MDKIYLVGACYSYEGTEPVRAFATQEEADGFAKVANDYHAQYPDSRDPEVRRKWTDNHPAPQNTACESFDVVEVPFGPKGGTQ